MRKIILTALLAATIMPAAAQAQQRHDDRGRPGDHRGPDDRGPGARPGDDRNRNWDRNDWRGYRDTNRNLYARGNWRAPFRYNAFRPGARIGNSYWGPQYVIADPWRYRLPPVRGAQRWVRHYDDVVLVDTRRGIVIDVINGFYR